MTRLLIAAAIVASCAQAPVGVDGETATVRSAAPAGTTSTMSSAMGKARPWPMRASRSRTPSPVHEQTHASRSRRTADPFGTGSHLNWAALRQCESSGNYTDRDSTRYFGAYQFDLTTWASVGGHGNPADASPAEQDMRARQLYALRGRRPWPVCGKRL